MQFGRCLREIITFVFFLLPDVIVGRIDEGQPASAVVAPLGGGRERLGRVSVPGWQFNRIKN